MKIVDSQMNPDMTVNDLHDILQGEALYWNSHVTYTQLHSYCNAPQQSCADYMYEA